MDKIFILIGNKKQQGKDTFAKMLQEELGDAEIFSFATPMREILSELMGMSPSELKELYTHNESIRSTMKTLGSGKLTEYFGGNIWRDLLISEANKSEAKYIIVSDFRFIREYIEDSITINITRDSIVSNDVHPSEVELDSFDWLVNVFNNGTLADLREIAEEFAEYVQAISPEEECECVCKYRRGELSC